MKINIKILLPVILFISVLMLIIGAFTFFRPQVHELPTNITEEKFTDFEKLPGIKDVSRFSDANKKINKTEINQTEGKAEIRPRPTIVLPYPRVSINYKMSRTRSIRNTSAETNKTFLIATLDIKNYGYQYFDAHPTKFKLTTYRNEEFVPIVSVGTGNMLETVLPNNSKTEGDLVFLLDRKISGSLKIKYIDSSYTILYNREKIE